MHGFERAELLGDREWRMVREHDPPGPEADVVRVSRNVSDQDARRRRRDRRHVVVLCVPDASVPQLLGSPGHGHARCEAVGRSLALPDRGQVEDR